MRRKVLAYRPADTFTGRAIQTGKKVVRGPVQAARSFSRTRGRSARPATEIMKRLQKIIEDLLAVIEEHMKCKKGSYNEEACR
jgi:hypothetical protein